jgi:hypothetical protein
VEEEGRREDIEERGGERNGTLKSELSVLLITVMVLPLSYFSQSLPGHDNQRGKSSRGRGGGGGGGGECV